jgi:4-aminobutyrate aminotransferase-like enzyme
VRGVAAPDAYRRAEGADIGKALADDVRAAIADLAANGVKPAAMIVDTVFSSDGVFTDPPGFLAEAVAVVRAAGGLFIADEVQAGFGRTGDALWGFQRHGIEPDIVTMGKPMGNGQPIGGLVTRPDIIADFGRTTRYFNTFGGNPVSCAAGLAVLEVIERDGLVDHAREVGAYLREGLRALAERHAAIGDVRGTGLFIGVEMVRDRATREPDDAEALRLVNDLRRRRILISASGPGANVLKIRPPLVLGKDHADLFLGALDEVLRRH